MSQALASNRSAHLPPQKNTDIWCRHSSEEAHGRPTDCQRQSRDKEAALSERAPIHIALAEALRTPYVIFESRKTIKKQFDSIPPRGKGRKTTFLGLQAMARAFRRRKALAHLTTTTTITTTTATTDRSPIRHRPIRAGAPRVFTRAGLAPLAGVCAPRVFTRAGPAQHAGVTTSDARDGIPDALRLVAPAEVSLWGGQTPSGVHGTPEKTTPVLLTAQLRKKAAQFVSE